MSGLYGAQCEVWYAPTGVLDDRALNTVCTDLLTPEDREQHAALLFEANRKELLLTRAMARWCLARQLGVRPSEIRFRRTKHGQPLLHPPSDVHFNMTNTTELVACVVSRGRDVGIDAEPLTRAKGILEIAHVIFTETERQWLANFEIDARGRRAVELWTHKEAYMKARGLGIGIPACQFSMLYDGTQVRLDDELDNDPARWELTHRVLENHVVATCVDRGELTTCPIEVRAAKLEELLFM